MSTFDPEHVIEAICEAIRLDRADDTDYRVHEALDGQVQNLTDAECIIVLDTFGDRDLSEPPVNCCSGWPKILRALTYNALDAEARSRR